MIRMGLIGCGSMGMVHLRGLQEIKDRLRFTALVDTDPERLAMAAEFAPHAVQSDNYRAVTHQVDAVLIALPHDLHFETAEHYLLAGKHVLLEKPLALTEEQCVRLVELDRSPNPMLMLGYPLRSAPAWIRLGELIRDQTFGKTFQVSIWTEQYTDTSRGAWLGQADRLGGGQLFSHGCHYIDQLMLWLGNPVEGTHMGTNLCTPWMDKEGTSNVSLRFEDGSLGYHFGTWGARGSRLRYSVHAHCEGGMIEYRQHEGLILLHEDKTGGDPHDLRQLAKARLENLSPTEKVIERYPADAGKAVCQQALNFVDSIEQGKLTVSPASDSLESLRVIWRLYEAEEQGRVADLRGLGLHLTPAGIA